MEKSFDIIALSMIILVTYSSKMVSVAGRSLHEPSIVEKHEKWMAEHGRTYKDDLEKEMRFKIFKENLEYIEKANEEANRTYKLGTNEFSDLTNEEFRASYTGYRVPSQSSSSRQSTTASFKYQNLTDVPTSMDWREKGAVTPIKNQGQCGDCWAFSAVAAVEGVTEISSGNLIPLSEQQILDCSIDGNRGCGGGWMDNAFKYIINQGIATEADYPYKEVQGTCEDAQVKVAAKISNFEDVKPNDEQALLQAVAMQPVSICIEGSGPDFQSYKGGIFNRGCGTQCSHAVAIVGFGATEDGMKYWLIKNSWGESWGEAGYMRILRDVEAPEGLCGIATKPSYPVA
ncbi:cysteine protease-like protein [Citrus sinensis]|uniref:Uncharacterized protein n=1 Tax=Citrus unshiu TaxID=55188 RepID=A0A2H5Q6J2_CITUN|nr:ervatamin-B-like [Citrus sinensis]KAH9647955.1 cysteine protease-like protein [Citrus sinensis]GAY60267.1 hypothetical protein CUMW_200610 [Citrus unshiu]